MLRMKRAEGVAPAPAPAPPLEAIPGSLWLSAARRSEDAVSPLPSHLWCWVAQHLDAASCGTALRVAPWLLAALDVQALWLHHCLVHGLAMPARGPGAGWLYPFPPRVSLADGVDWRRLLCANMRLQRAASVWVRVQDVDLRLPVSSETTGKALMAELSCIVAVGDDGMPALPSYMPVMEEEQERPRWPLRLRHLQWGGRPGLLLHDGPLPLGGHFLLEWPLPARRGWPLVPTSSPSRSSSRAVRSSSKLCYQGMAALPWLHGTAAPAAQDAAAPAASRKGEPPTALMIRILSLLLPRELWLSVPLDATWGTLSREIAKTLRRESPLLADLCRPLKYHLMDTERPKEKAAVHETKPLRDLFWAQSETLLVELESSGSQRLARAAVGQSGEAGGDLCLAVLVWREAAFREAPASAADGPSVQSCFGSPGALSRQMTEPAPMQSSRWSRQMSEPVPLRNSDMMERLEDALDDFDFELLSSPPGGALSPSREPCAQPETPGGTEYAVADARPGSPAEQARLGGEPDQQGAAEPDGGYDYAAGHCWERLVPHYAPQLLPRTVLTRQFEFHPTLPDVILTGDKRGNVNILNLETDEVHPFVAVGSNPLLGLVWMRRNPQRAVCGASHSGRIVFLEYDPSARPHEPALRRLHKVEEFPKLSSLSSNCTDDFLLASGISPNIAVYDMQTGQVLHRAHGVHEHFINISRFCHNSPHVFATASFDNTCKVWDLRQPLVHDRPVKTLTTGSHNVMCVFSPDDKYVLCSGVDTRIMQFEVPSWRQTPDHFPLREPVHRERYRRSTYLATGRHFVTAATEESHMHLMTVEGKKLGVVDFRGVVQQWTERSQSPNARGPATEPCCLQVPRLAMQLESRIFSARAPHYAGLHRSGSAGSQDRLGESGLCAVGQPRQNLVQGRVQLDDADPNGGSSWRNHEFIQSIRTHPVVKNRVGVLLSLTQAEQSYVALVDMEPKLLDE